MRRLVLAALAASVALAGCAYDRSKSTLSPSNATGTIATPSRIVLNIVPGIGSSVTQAAVAATVVDVNGAGIGGVTVTFATTVGTLSRSIVVTDQGGLASTTLTSVKPATVTASTGTVSSSAPAAINADLIIALTTTNAITNQATGFSAAAYSATGAVQYLFQFGDGFFNGPGPNTATHFYGKAGTYNISVSATDAAGRTGTTASTLTVTDPPPTTTGGGGSSNTGPATLTISLTCTPATTHGNPTYCNVTAAYGGATLPSASITNVAWDWGDQVPDPSTSPANSHTYSIAGNFTVFATVTATPSASVGSLTAATSKAITVP